MESTLRTHRNVRSMATPVQTGCSTRRLFKGLRTVSVELPVDAAKTFSWVEPVSNNASIIV